ncbi:uncharacterized protein LY89DRAFT_668111 [Mollisia scopiformis]|uniref:Fucose-specific lectin n=1 Tax=Mollisia scopiformis TaxID=149040 RepID=A0A194XDS1_MOLSC|nr:uncharacterized protein LY89DRAFT_668111 [Mollisia scopiformis]KUJ17897.1 hypothetical protein LY89DRAFT_668111 [Mollisia scopiformis]
MGDVREPETPRVKTALMQTIRVVNIKKPTPPPKRPYVDEKEPPSTASSSKSSFTFRVPRAPRSAPPIPRIRQSIITFSFGSKAPSLNSSLPPAEQLIFGLRRKQFYAYLGASIVLFLVSVIIGLAVLSGASKPFVPPFAGIAASTLFLPNTTQQTAALFFQDPSTNGLNLRISPDVDSLPFSPPQRLNLMKDEFPTQNLSLAATSFASMNGFGSVFHQLFYVMDASIMVMNLSCSSISPARCEIISNNMISNSLLPTMAPDSGIAAVYLEAEMGWKVFYHNDAYAISCASYENGTWNTTGIVMGSKAVRGSSIAAAVFRSNIEVLYVDQTMNMLFAVESMNGTWMPPTQVTPIQPSTFSPTSSLAISYASKADVLLAYYLGTDSNIYQFVGREASTLAFPVAISSDFTGRTTPGWTNTPTNVTGGGGGVASIGFEDQLMIFSAEGREVDMSSLNTTSGVFLPSVAI